MGELTRDYARESVEGLRKVLAETGDKTIVLWVARNQLKALDVFLQTTGVRAAIREIEEFIAEVDSSSTFKV